MGHDQLSERAQHLLKALVQRYVREGKPVGSRVLARETGLDLSPATVRNVMADLEDAGFVCAPHTSAGRIPTGKGYRFFVDTLLTVEPLNEAELERLQQHFDRPDQDPKGLVESASALLSRLTHMAGVVTLPRRTHRPLRRVEFLPLSERQVLAILVINAREVENRIIETDRAYTESELQQMANYLTGLVAGKDLVGARQALLRELKATRESMDRMMQAAIDMAEKVFSGPSGEDADGFVVAGQTNLMEFEELSDIEKLRRLFEAFNQKRDMLHLLDRCIQATGVQIFIGEESGSQVFGECSLITAPYAGDDQVLGVLGVIGPTRMAYDRVIPVVDVTARLLGAALNART